jgi:hypothetical protein
MRSSLGFILLLAVVLGASAAGLAWQRGDADSLRAELARLRVVDDEIARLERERDRLRAQQIPAEELARLRADRAALPRLRAEIEALRRK